ncbi:MAG: 50S ribosomal protein L4 [Planctomycetota bacterium]|nr:50S ribosomal protein L4 [Planctomycetaceae bacterium]MDQ3331903.1 50S ribosomal protein L4 [Planctomycetota bacterium]
MAEKISIPVRDSAGGEVGTYEFDPAELAPGINKQLLHDVVVMYEANRRVGTMQSRSRGMVKGSNKKMYKQKGTGRARMGNKRTPIRRGGGHSFAKTPRDFGYSMPKKAVRLATRMALLSKFLDDQAVVIDGLAVDGPRTKPVADLFKAIGLYGQGCTLAVAGHDANVWKSARNLATVMVSPASDLNAYTVLHQRHLVITRDALDVLLGRNQKAEAAA